MDISDLRTLAAGAVVEAEVCVVGSGPVEHAVAAELAFAGVSIIVIESGGREPQPLSDEIHATVQAAFEAAGVRFLDDEGAGWGLQMQR